MAPVLKLFFFFPPKKAPLCCTRSPLILLSLGPTDLPGENRAMQQHPCWDVKLSTTPLLPAVPASRQLSAQLFSPPPKFPSAFYQIHPEAPSLPQADAAATGKGAQTPRNTKPFIKCLIPHPHPTPRSGNLPEIKPSFDTLSGEVVPCTCTEAVFCALEVVNMQLEQTNQHLFKSTPSSFCKVARVLGASLLKY